MRSAQVRGLRGATTCEEDTPAAIEDATQELLRAMMDRNELAHDDVVSVIFTTTRDLTSTFPATWHAASASATSRCCARARSTSPARCRMCIRILMHVYTTRSRSELRHVYLRNAQGLRDDLPE